MVLCVLLAIVAVTGCTHAPPPTPVKPILGYRFKVIRSSGYTSGEASTFSIQGDQSSVEMKDQRLTIDGKNFGMIPEGATILVEEDGRVLINGSEKTAESP
jgi:hypothetical protein